MHTPLPMSCTLVGGAAAVMFTKPLPQPPSNSGNKKPPARCPNTLRVRVQQDEACRLRGRLSASLSLDNFWVTTFPYDSCRALVADKCGRQPWRMWVGKTHLHPHNQPLIWDPPAPNAATILLTLTNRLLVPPMLRRLARRARLTNGIPNFMG